MKNSWKKWGLRLWRPAVAVAGLAGMLMYSGGGCAERIVPGSAGHEAGVVRPPDAVVVTARVEQVSAKMELAGTVASEEKIHLSARIPAQVTRVQGAAGEAVKAGQVLIELDDREIAEQMAAAAAASNQAETEWHRVQRLFESKAATEQMLTAAAAQSQAARAQAERIRVMLSYAKVAAPMDGVIAERRVEAGDLANPGQVLVTVYDPKRLRLEVPIPVRWIECVQKGQRMEMKLDRPDRLLQGEVTEILGEIDPVSRTQTIRVHVREPEGVFPGMFGRLWIHATLQPSLRIPETAVRRAGQLEQIYVLKNGRAEKRLIRTQPAEAGWVEVASGLSAGEVVWANPPGRE